MSWQIPIYDRTEQDIQNVKTILNKILTEVSGYESLTSEEQNLINGRTRGTFSSDTMNRLCGNISYLRTMLSQAGYNISIETDDTYIWTYMDTVTYDDVIKILNDCRKIKNAVDARYHSLPMDYELYYLDIHILNKVEKLLNDVKTGLEAVKETTVISGDVICGACYAGGSKWKTD